MATTFKCAVCEHRGLGCLATHRLVLGAFTVYLCRDHAEQHAGDATLRRWEAA